ncbi:hypothetical protein V8C40DRAFT_281699 [Trichoderma camerunense]
MSGSFNPDLFIAAVSSWQQSVDFRDLFNRIQSALGNGRDVIWRPGSIRDFRNLEIPTAAERLVRWDRRNPEEIFRTGFEPCGDANSQCNIEAYVLHNQDSPFISTARCYREGGCPMRWRPYRTPFATNRVGFEYEIFAYGGIDVNISIGRNHRYAGQREIAFPGGIRREFIRSALEYDSNGDYVRYWINTHFDFNANGPNHSPNMSQMPNHLFPDAVEIVFFEESNEQPSPDHDRELRAIHRSQSFDEFMTADGGEDEIRFVGTAFKTLSEDYAPELGGEYAINVLGTSMVLTCKNNEDLVLDIWQGKDSQRFRCTEQDGYTGFICVGAGGGQGRYLGYNAYEWLACSARKQDKWEHFFVRAHPEGGFQLWMFKDDHLAPVKRIDQTTLRMMASSSTRFGFTRLGTSQDSRGTWNDVSSRKTDIPQEGCHYAIKILNTSKAFTCIDGTEMRLRLWEGRDTQTFRCTMFEGNMGFICEGADGGKGKYLGFNAWEVLACQADYQRAWEHIHLKANPHGGFMGWMKKDAHLAPIKQVSEDEVKMMAESSTLISFTKIE